MSRDLSEYYIQTYLTESAPTRLEGDQGQDVTLEKHGDVEDVVEYDDLEFDLDDELSQETYYAGGDEGDSRNSNVTPKIKKKGKSVKKESFQELYKSILLKEMDEFDGDFTDDTTSYEDDSEGFEGEDEGTVEISVSTIRDIISQLEGLMGAMGGVDDEFDTEFDDVEDDGLEDDDEFPMESWDGGKGDTRMKGDYSGKPKSLAKSNLNDKGKAKTGFRPDSNTSSKGDQKLNGDYSGKATGSKDSNLSSKSSTKIKRRTDNLFGADE